MAAITELEVVNNCLNLLGEASVNSLAEPREIISSIRTTFNNTLKTVQVKEWWFNTEIVTLQPQFDGTISIPADIISVRVLGTDPRFVSIRAGKLYNNREGGVYVGGALKCQIQRLVAFDDLPMSAQLYVAARTTEKFCLNFDADTTKISEARSEANAAHVMMVEEDLNAARPNMLTQGAGGAGRIRNRVHTYPRRV